MLSRFKRKVLDSLFADVRAPGLWRFELVICKEQPVESCMYDIYELRKGTWCAFAWRPLSSTYRHRQQGIPYFGEWWPFELLQAQKIIVDKLFLVTEITDEALFYSEKFLDLGSMLVDQLEKKILDQAFLRWREPSPFLTNPSA